MPPESPHAGAAPSANYAYWQEHGGEWADEYDRRKQRLPYFHIQELMLTSYLLGAAPAKVLEFGCGVGRHLQNLVKVPGLDVHGYDQSPTMVAQCRRWTNQAWLDTHVTVGAPTGRLPYDDASFDIVYTSEVLVHVRPEDLGGILSELLRITRGHVLHFEPAETFRVVSNEHAGCWSHDFVGAYARLGKRCELLPCGYVCQRPYRVQIGETPAPLAPWPPIVLELYRRMEHDLVTGFDQLRMAEASERAQRELASGEAVEARHALADTAHALELSREEARLLQARVAALDAQLAALSAEYARLQASAHGANQSLAHELARARQRMSELLAERDLFLLRADQIIRS